MNYDKVKKIEPKVQDIINLTKKRKQQIKNKDAYNRITKNYNTDTERIDIYLLNLDLDELKIIHALMMIGKRITTVKFHKEKLNRTRENIKIIFENNYNIDVPKAVLVGYISGSFMMLDKYLEYGIKYFLKELE